MIYFPRWTQPRAKPYAHACAYPLYACMSMSMFISPSWPATVPPWSVARGKLKFLFFLMKLSYLSCRPCHVATLVACLPPPLSNFHHAHLLHFSPPSFYICFLFLMAHICFGGYFFNMWPLFFGKIAGHVSIFWRLPPQRAPLYIDCPKFVVKRFSWV